MKEPIRIGISELKAGHNPDVFVCLGLGSCMAVVLYDPAVKVGGVAHIMLPKENEAKEKSNRAKFADSAIEMLLCRLKELGAKKQRVKAKIFGGANMFGHLPKKNIINIGERNSCAVREELAKRGIDIVASEIGGGAGRSIVFDTRDGSVLVKSINGSEKLY